MVKVGKQGDAGLRRWVLRGTLEARRLAPAAFPPEARKASELGSALLDSLINHSTLGGDKFLAVISPDQHRTNLLQ